MKHRKLRIAWSVAWGVVAVLLCVMWVRSYWWADAFHFPITGKHLLGVGSAQGGMTAIKSEFVPGYYKSRWQLDHESTADPSIAEVYQPKNRPGYYGALGLGIIDSAPFFVVCIPYWLLLSAAIAVATAPWLPWSKRFSLRTLLIAITIIGLMLGTIVWLS
jgi:hypothetical protein